MLAAGRFRLRSFRPSFPSVARRIMAASLQTVVAPTGSQTLSARCSPVLRGLPIRNCGVAQHHQLNRRHLDTGPRSDVEAAGTQHVRHAKVFPRSSKAQFADVKHCHCICTLPDKLLDHMRIYQNFHIYMCIIYIYICIYSYMCIYIYIRFICRSGAGLCFFPR